MPMHRDETVSVLLLREINLVTRDTYLCQLGARSNTNLDRKIRHFFYSLHVHYAPIHPERMS